MHDVVRIYVRRASRDPEVRILTLALPDGLDPDTLQVLGFTIEHGRALVSVGATDSRSALLALAERERDLVALLTTHGYLACFL